MKKVIRASEDISNAKKVFSVDDVLILLHWIEELKGLEISLSKIPSGEAQLVVGDCAYPLETIIPGLKLYE